VTLRVFSLGGGVQSTAALVLAARGEIDFRTFLFCNVGEDSESPDTLRYVAQHSRPYAAAHRLELVELRKTYKGQPDSVLARFERNPSSPNIPMRGQVGMPAFNRACTRDFKITQIQKWCREHGATTEQPAVTGIGFSADEFNRVGRRDDDPAFRREYPLITLRLTRGDCMRVVQEAGLPTPPRSSCWFCPYHTTAEWRRLQRDHPALFDRAAELEASANAAFTARGARPAWLTRYAKPLPMAVPAGGQTDFLEEMDGTCDTGHCMT
jgi:hypothetical protein